MWQHRPVRVTFICPSGTDPIGGVHALYEFGNGLARRGHEVHLCHLPMWGRQVRSLDDLHRYRFEPDVRHYFPGDPPESMPDTDVIFGTGAPARLGLPVHLIQGIDMLHDGLERSAFQTPSLKIAVASWLVAESERHGLDPERIEVVPYGIDHGRFRTVVPPEERPCRVGILHHTHAAKGWDVGLAALEAARAQVPELTAVAFGTSAPAEVPDWLDVVVDPEPEVLVRDVYNASQVFLQTSDYEGFGFTAVEAMACGAALVTTDNGGSDDYARPGETALVAPPRDVSGLTAAVVELLRDREQRLSLAKAGAELARTFDWDRSAERLESVLLAYLADPDRYLTPAPAGA